MIQVDEDGYPVPPKSKTNARESVLQAAQHMDDIADAHYIPSERHLRSQAERLRQFADEQYPLPEAEEAPPAEAEAKVEEAPPAEAEHSN